MCNYPEVHHFFSDPPETTGTCEKAAELCAPLKQHCVETIKGNSV